MDLKDFDRIECVCVDHRRNEWQLLEKQFRERGAKISRFIVGKGKVLPQHIYSQIDTESIPPEHPWGNFTKNAYHCHIAHRNILQRAKDDSLKNLLILEDDCKLLDNFDEILSKVKQQIDELKIKWDMLYYGCNHKWGMTKKISENLLELYGVNYCWHCVAINQEHHDMFQHLLDFPVSGPFDWLTAMQTQTNREFHCYSIWPAIAIQKPGMSYVEGSVQDYTSFFEEMGTPV